QGIEMPAIVAVSRDREIPLSFAQQRLWFLDQLEPNSAFYNIPAAIRLNGQLNVSALQQSINEVIKRHEILRTSYHSRQGEPLQLISPYLEINLIVEQVATQVQAQQEAILEAQRPFDLSKPPLLRVRLLQLGENEHVLLFTMHHIVSDAWSRTVLVGEIATLYQAYCRGEISPLAELPIQYADYAQWQQDWLQGDVLEKQLSYWRRKLEGFSPLKLPTDHPRPVVQSHRGANESLRLSVKLAEKIRALSRNNGVTPFMAMLAAFKTLLYRYTGQLDIVVGTDIANRNKIETEKLIGFFINLLVLRTDLSGNPSFKELLQRVREVTLDAYTFQNLPFEKLVAQLSPERTLSQNPLVQVLFVFQNIPTPTIESQDITISPVEFEPGTTRFDLALFIHEDAQGMMAVLTYSTDLFNTETARRILAQFHTLLSSIVAQPDVCLNDLEIFSEVEQKQQIAKQQLQESYLEKLIRIKPKPINLSGQKLVKTRLLFHDKELPLVIEPELDDIDLIDWARNNTGFIETNLSKYGAILFRGFNIKTEAEFESFAASICPDLFGEYGDLPRESIKGKVYGSTPYPSEQAILFHNESSHLNRWPMKIWFFCIKAAEQGGETPIVDCRKVYQSLDPHIRDRFAEKGLMYVRNYSNELDVSWQHFFRTTEKSMVEDFCRSNSIDFHWKDGDRLRTKLIRPAVTNHPKTGELLFFNQVQLHHISCLEAFVRQSMLSLLKEEDMPRNVYYGDGSIIEDSIIEAIREIYEKLAVRFLWQEGDILMLDNMLVAHGRSPFTGTRKIVVTMGEMTHGA
ncbi:MAG: condensation domain-containing protein, partial [Acidobacteriota bacterium]